MKRKSSTNLDDYDRASAVASDQVIKEVKIDDDSVETLSLAEQTRKKTLAELNQTMNIDRKIKQTKKEREAHPEELMRDREKIKQYKNMPSLRQALESIKTAR